MSTSIYFTCLVVSYSASAFCGWNSVRHWGCSCSFRAVSVSSASASKNTKKEEKKRGNSWWPSLILGTSNGTLGMKTDHYSDNGYCVTGGRYHKMVGVQGTAHGRSRVRPLTADRRRLKKWMAFQRMLSQGRRRLIKWMTISIFNACHLKVEVPYIYTCFYAEAPSSLEELYTNSR